MAFFGVDDSPLQVSKGMTWEARGVGSLHNYFLRLEKQRMSVDESQRVRKRVKHEIGSQHFYGLGFLNKHSILFLLNNQKRRKEGSVFLDRDFRVQNRSMPTTKRASQPNCFLSSSCPAGEYKFITGNQSLCYFIVSGSCPMPREDFPSGPRHPFLVFLP